MVGRTLAKLEVSLGFCWDYGWQNVGKVRSFALILLELWLAERWQSEKFRFDFVRIMVGRTLAKWKKFRFDFAGIILAERWQSEKFHFDFARIMVGRTLAKWERSFALILLGWTLAKWKKFRFDFTRILAQRWQSEKSFALILLGFWHNVGKVRSFAWILLGLWLAERWQSEKFRFDFAGIMVGRTLAKWEVSLGFCSDYGWQNARKKLVERWFG